MVDLTLKLKSLISSLTIGLIITSCNYPSASLPSKTHEGKNTYGYQLIRMNSKEIFSGISDLENDINIDSLHFININFSNSIEGLYYDKEVILSIILDQNFELINSKLTYFHRNYTLDPTQLNYCETSYTDTNKRIISGNFEFNLILFDSTYQSIDSSWTYNNIDSVKITKGRFDLKY